MRHLTRTTVAGVSLAAVLVGTDAVMPAVASAAELGQTSVTLPMTVGGFDARVAEANGYRIVTNGVGEKRSVPITAKAKMDAERPGVRNTVTGNCGSATLTITRNNSRGGINIQTGYTVKGTSVGHHWGVSGASNAGKAFTEGFSGVAGGSRWSATHFKAVYGYGQGGFGQIDVGSFAQLANGAMCFAGKATSNWK